MFDHQQQRSRRDFLAAAGATSAGWLATQGMSAPARAADQETDAQIAFFLIGDTHYLADKDDPASMSDRSAGINARLIDTLNRLPGTELPQAAGGGAVRAPRGVIHAGDLIDTGDKNGPVQQKMQRTEWEAFVADFGLTGKDGKLKYPLYEVHGNHDSPGGKGLVIDGIVDRNRSRPGVKNVSANGLHYSWDWGPVHFVNLGIVVGETAASSQKRRYAPLGSLDFLAADLKEHVGDSGRPVVLTHHVDVVRYSLACQPDDPANLGKEWHPCDVRAYYEAVEKYRVAGLLYGHTHARAVLRWNGSSAKAERGLPLFNVDNSGHFGSDLQACFYFEIGPRELVVRELATRDAWQTHAWTPQVWRHELA